MARDESKLDPDAPYGLGEHPETQRMLQDPNADILTRGWYDRMHWSESDLGSRAGRDLGSRPFEYDPDPLG